jgi:hypothetical protein
VVEGNFIPFYKISIVSHFAIVKPISTSLNFSLKKGPFSGSFVSMLTSSFLPQNALRVSRAATSSSSVTLTQGHSLAISLFSSHREMIFGL